MKVHEACFTETKQNAFLSSQRAGRASDLVIWHDTCLADTIFFSREQFFSICDRDWVKHED